jgi:(2Fe-2S) ferredoxin
LTSSSAYSTLTSLQRKRYLFVCINRRPEENPKGCCAAKDSEEVYRALKGEIATRGLAKLEARVCRASCLDQCATGVTVLVEADHFFYGRVTVADVPDIVDGLVKGQPVNGSWLPRINTMELDGMSDIEHVAIGNRAGRRQRS